MLALGGRPVLQVKCVWKVGSEETLGILQKQRETSSNIS